MSNWTLVAPSLNSQTSISALCVFNNKLYGGTYPNGRLFEWNGTNAWVEVAPQLNSQQTIQSLCVFNGKLYGGTYNGGRLFEWNSTNAWVEVAPQLNSQTAIWSLCVFNGKLYGGAYGGGRLFEWNGTNAWVEVATRYLYEGGLFSLNVFNGKLYGGTSTFGYLFRWNDLNAWTSVAMGNVNSPVYGAALFDHSIYAIRYWTTYNITKLHRWNRVNAWTTVITPTSVFGDFISIASFNGVLYAGTGTTQSRLYRADVDITADFSASPLSGYTPLSVAFFDLSLMATSWDWDFGDGTFHSSLQDPTHIYTTPGIYTVILSINGGASVKTRTNYITVTTSVSADFSAFPLSGSANLSVQFTDLSTGATSWLWDFGDGHISINQNPLHVYTEYGTYTVSLTINSSITETKPDYVQVTLLVDFSASPLLGNADLTVEFTDLTVGGAISWSWDFGDGHTSTDQNPSHVYTHGGTYTINLTVNGITTGTKTDYITVNLLADFVGSPLYGKIPLSVFFTDRSKGNPSLWTWSFGDGTILSGTQNQKHIYTQPGIYTVSLIISRGIDTEEEVKENYIIVLYPLYTEDVAIPEDRQDLRFMPIQGNGNYLFSKNGIRVIILRSNTSPAGSGFGRSSGPSLIFD